MRICVYIYICRTSHHTSSNAWIKLYTFTQYMIFHFNRLNLYSNVLIIIFDNTFNIPLVLHTHIYISHMSIHSQSFVKMQKYVYSTVFALRPCNTGPFLRIYVYSTVFALRPCHTGPFLLIYEYSTVFALRPCHTGPFLLIYVYSTVFALRPCHTGPFLRNTIYIFICTSTHMGNNPLVTIW